MNKEWETEPDLDVFGYKNYLCKIVRHSYLKVLLGYVKIPATSFYYGKNINYRIIRDLDAHGGITFSGYLDGDSDGWWIGFDCGHGGLDLAPKFFELIPDFEILDETYKNFEYVRGQLKSLVDQIIELDQGF
jgi:hypothetical protein